MGSFGWTGFGTDAKSIFSKQNLAEMIKSIRPDITLKVGNISDSGDVIKSALRKGSRRARSRYIEDMMLSLSTNSVPETN